MRRCFVSLCCCLLLLGLAGCRSAAPGIIYIPPDTRPASTQYVSLIGEIGDQQVIMPEAGLSDYLTPGDSEVLWQWLETQPLGKNDRVIITTNMLFHGGLIQSRSLAGYADWPAQVARLAAYCQEVAAHEVTVLTILPRLKPSQFEVAMWAHEEALTAWGEALGQAMVAGAPLPEAPPEVPAEVAAAYWQVFRESEAMVLALGALADEGIIDHLVVGQDDAAHNCPSNGIMAHLAQADFANTTLTRGADELPMLLVATGGGSTLDAEIIYTNPARADEVLPYEGTDLASVVATKLALAGIHNDPESKRLIIIHNDPSKSAEVLHLIDNNQKKVFIGIADVAYTNKGDPRLYRPFTKDDYYKKIDSYAGWNTASNSIGTVAAFLVANTSKASDSKRVAKKDFQSIRLCEDLIYQARIAPILRAQFLADGVSDFTTTFAPGRALEAQARLNNAWAPYREELQALREQDITLTFPWNRAFEVKVIIH